MKTLGRRPGPTCTRPAILKAAVGAFAARGYTATSLRHVARLAAVDPSLVHRFFGSKRRLFEAAVVPPVDPADLRDRLLGGGTVDLADRLLAELLSLWDDGATTAALLAVLRSLPEHDGAVDLVTENLVDGLLRTLAESVDAADAELRAALAASQLLGLALARHVIPLDAIAAAPRDTLRALVAPALESYLARGRSANADRC